MTRRRKLLTAGFILALGLVLAWPFRKAPGESEGSYAPTEMPSEPMRAGNGDPIAAAHLTPAIGIPVAPDPVAARAASTKEPANKLESFDLANHPAIANVQDSPAALTGTELHAALTDSRPVYSTTTTDSSPKWPDELIHVVANGDTLEKLAERYLNDAGRALEIFDLNRDQLTNPHLLPIGAELRVPVDPHRIID